MSAAFIHPWRPTVVAQPPSGPGWAHELKHDGYRLQIHSATNGSDGVADFDALHSRVNDHNAIACAFDLLMLNGDDLRKKPFSERKAALRKVLNLSNGGIQYVEHSEGDGAKMFRAVCQLGLEGIVSKKLDSLYRSGPSKSWLKTKNPKAPAATRAADGRF